MKPTTISHLRQAKASGKKFATLTAYDFSFARLFADEGIQVLLVGDSLGRRVEGHDATLPVTVSDIAYHAAAVRRGAPQALLLADLPFMSYATPQQTFDNAAQLMRAGANMVKLEGGSWLAETVQMLTERAVPVCGHLGLTPQSVNIFGGYKVQGKDEQSAKKLIEDSIKCEEAGAMMLVLECVPAELTAKIAETLSIPVIGIGAGVKADGQVLVYHDIIGHGVERTPKFVKQYTRIDETIETAISGYVQDVRHRAFPEQKHSFQMNQTVLDGLYGGK